MSNYDNRNFSSDLDTYKGDGAIRTASISISSETISASSTYERFTSWQTFEGLDYYHVIFKNSYWSTTLWQNLINDQLTFLHETTYGSDLTTWVFVQIQPNRFRFGLRAFNPYGATISLSDTVISFRLTPFTDTGIQLGFGFSDRVTSGGDSRVTSGGDSRISVV